MNKYKDSPNIRALKYLYGLYPKYFRMAYSTEPSNRFCPTLEYICPPR